ncbi:hypothetical protein K503DRAFT_250448 [Rhizopogon vinicolor AM-OR11-026]|uniref:Uncharacterized protein n=1 Tax=Rhizopogon vinicolor AM-OR11-026 TaxID=1314800 RepID=A0A1B7MX48_9AGAM|nr:hypothetical protein K503DRAFT_250448 [Rhizopogon vinicolor AM-OR11-026]
MVRFQGPASRIFTPEPYQSSSPRRGVLLYCEADERKNDLPKQIVRKMKTHRLESRHSFNRYYARTPVTLQQSLSHLLAIMKELLSFVLITMAFLKMTAAAPTVLERSSDVDKRTDQTRRGVDLVAEGFPETEDVEKRYLDIYVVSVDGTEDVEKRNFIISD